MKTPKPKTLYRLFVTRFHSRTERPNKFEKTENDWRYKREQMCVDRPFDNPRQAKQWVTDQIVTTNGIRDEWCELWGQAIPVSDKARCERVRLEFERYEEVPLFGEEQAAQIRSESLRALHA